MSRDVFEDAFLRTGDEVAGAVAVDIIKIVHQRGKETLHKGLTLAVAAHNEVVVREEDRLMLSAIKSDAFGEGYAVFLSRNFANMRTAQKFGSLDAQVAPVLDLRIKETKHGLCVIHVLYGDKDRKPIGFDTLAILHTESLPFLDVHDHKNIAQVVRCAFDIKACPDQPRSGRSNKNKRRSERHHAS